MPNRYDGNWSIEVITSAGPCDRAYRYGVQIQRGEASYPGGDFDIRGRVAANGVVRATISRGSDGANVVGRLGRDGQRPHGRVGRRAHNRGDAGSAR